MKRKNFVAILMSVFGLLWVLTGLITIVWSNNLTPVINLLLLNIFGLIGGCNADLTDNRPDIKTAEFSLIGQFKASTKKVKVMMLMAFILTPFVFCIIYYNAKVFLGYDTDFSVLQKIVLTFFWFLISFIPGFLIGIGIKKWFPVFAEKLNYV